MASLKREHWLALIAVSLGLLGSGALAYVRQASTQLVPVLVAAHDVQSRQVLRKEDLEIRMVPPAVRDDLALQDPARLVGQVLVSPIFAGEQIRPGRIRVNEKDLGPDEVAVAFNTDLANAVGGLLEAGDVVDVYLVPLAPGQAQKVAVYKVGEAFRVFSVRDNAARATGPRANTDPTRSQGVSGVPAVVVLKVPSDMVTGLRQAAAIGTITFAKRSPIALTPDKPALISLPSAVSQLDVRGVSHPTTPPTEGVKP